MYLLRIGVLATLLIPGIASAAISIRFESDGVVASGMTRGGKVIAASFERLPEREQRGANRVLVSDNNGQVRIALGARATERSVWVFVDFQTGDYAASKPEGASVELDFRGGGFKETAPGQLKRLLHKSSTRLNLVVVRPNEGAWAIRGADGGGSDRDKSHNGTLELDPEDCTPLRDFGPAPKHFGKGDVVIGIDPYSLNVFAAKVGK
jgi:hypothetical protein